MKPLIQITCFLFISFGYNLWSQAGKLDSTFADNGFFESFAPLSFDDMIPLPNGNTLIIGASEVNNFRFGVGIKNIDPQGNIIGSYSHNFGVGVPKNLSDAALTPNGKVVGVGFHPGFNDSCLIIMFHTDGALDSTVNKRGYWTLPFPEIGHKVIPQKDGRFIILGTLGGGRATTVIRVLSDFQMDSTWGRDGIIRLNEPIKGNSDISQQADGKILILSQTYNSFEIMRLDEDGKVDIQFGASGLFTKSFTGRIEELKLVIQNSGKIVTMAQVDSVTHLVRINPDGAVDSTFGTNGVVTIQVPETATMGVDMALQVDGKILLGGNIEDSSKSSSCFWLHRLLSNGIPDYSFGDSAHAISPAPYKNAPVKQLCIQYDGNIIMGSVSTFDYPGQFADDFFLMARFTSGVNLGLLDFNSPSSIVQIYPNPIQQTAKLNFSLSQSEQLSIELYDLQGRKIQTFFEAKTFKQGDNEIELSFKEVTSSGYYMLSLRNGKRMMSVKVLKE